MWERRHTGNHHFKFDCVLLQAPESWDLNRLIAHRAAQCTNSILKWSSNNNSLLHWGIQKVALKTKAFCFHAFFLYGSWWFEFKSKSSRQKGGWALQWGAALHSGKSALKAKNLISWPSLPPVSGTHWEPNQPPAVAQSLSISLLKTWFSPQPTRGQSSSRKTSYLQGPTLEQMQYFLSSCSVNWQVLVGASAVFLCLKKHWVWVSRAAYCGLAAWHVPYIIPNQYLSSCSPRTLWRCSVFL